MISSLAYCFTSRLTWQVYEDSKYFIFHWVDEAILGMKDVLYKSTILDVVSKTKVLVEDPVDVIFLVDRVTGSFCKIINIDKVMNVSLVYFLVV
jgi:hypothetical protein